MLFLSWLLNAALTIAMVFVLTVLAPMVPYLLLQPLASSLVLLRANYLPRAVALGLGDDGDGDGDGDGQGPRSGGLFSIQPPAVKIGPVTSGVMGMAKRVVSIEGVAGLWRGFFPAVLQMQALILLGALVIAPFVAAGFKWQQAAAAGQLGALGTAVSLLALLFTALPGTVLAYRTIVHPHQLSWTKPVQNLRVLFSPGERKQPWRLYTLPGLALVSLMRLLLSAFAAPMGQRICFGPSPTAGSARVTVLPADQPGSAPVAPRLTPMRLAAFIVWQIIILSLSVPLQCAEVRLATQRPRESVPPAPSGLSAGASINPVSHQSSVSSELQASQEGESDEQAPLGAWRAHADAQAQAAPYPGGGREDPIIILRPCASSEIEADAGNGTVGPYLGLFHCLSTMVAEEGIESIFRGWGFSFGLLVLSACTLLV